MLPINCEINGKKTFKEEFGVADPDPQLILVGWSGSGSRGEKDAEKRNSRKCVVLKCRIFFLEGWRLLGSFDVLHEGLGINSIYCNFLPKNINFFPELSHFTILVIKSTGSALT
jgi:hypothetical protein